VDDVETIRKNFTMSEKVAGDLEFLAAALHKKQSQVIQDLIERETYRLRKQERLTALEKLAGSFTGKLDKESSIQSMKGNREI
jgi:hypothetical protein